MTTPNQANKPPSAAPGIYAAIARALAPRKALTVSQWSDKNRRLSSKGSAMAGQWVTATAVTTAVKSTTAATKEAAKAQAAAVKADIAGYEEMEKLRTKSLFQ